ncbi:DNA-directed DNA polymerase [Tanacetum coccineum]
MVSNFMASQDARLSKFEGDFKHQQSEMTNKIDTVLKAITNRIAGALPSDTVKKPKLSTTLVLSARSYPTIDPQCSSHPSTSINPMKAHFKEATISQTSLRRPKIENEPQQPEGPEPTLENEFQDLHLNLPVLEVFAHAPIYNSILDKLGDSKPFDNLADLGSCVNIIPLYLFKKLNIRLLEETDHIFGLADGTKSYPVGIVKDVEVHIGKLKLLNDFYVIDMKKDFETPLLVGRGFLATTNAVIDCRMAKIADKPPKNGDGAWHAKIRLIDPDEEEFTKTIQSIPTTRKLSEKESPREIIDLDHFYDTSLEVLRKFHWMILGGRFNQLSHVSSPSLSKPEEY